MGMMFHRYSVRRREKEKAILAERAVQKPETVEKPMVEEKPEPVKETRDFRREQSSIPHRRGRKKS